MLLAALGACYSPTGEATCSVQPRHQPLVSSANGYWELTESNNNPLVWKLAVDVSAGSLFGVQFLGEATLSPDGKRSRAPISIVHSAAPRSRSHTSSPTR